jgi:hypothetical protein
MCRREVRQREGYGVFRRILAFLGGWLARATPRQRAPGAPAPNPRSSIPGEAVAADVPTSADQRRSKRRDTRERQALSWPARDLSRSRRAATAEDTTVVVPRPDDPSQPDPTAGEDDATVVLPRADAGKGSGS